MDIGVAEGMQYLDAADPGYDAGRGVTSRSISVSAERKNAARATGRQG